jgi:DNA-binding NarL/FixJ family response regulator
MNQGWSWSECSRRELFTSTQWEGVSRALQLTEREQQVCQLLLKGKTRIEIAEDLEVKPRTIRQFMEQIHSKLRVKNRVGVVVRLVQVRDFLNK